MALVPHKVTALAESDAQGTNGKNIVENAVVSLYKTNGVAAILYDDENGTNGSTVKTTDTKGQVVVFVEPGNYDEEVNGSTRRRIKLTQLVGDDPESQRTALGLGSAALKNVGNSVGDVVIFGAFGFGTDNAVDVTTGSCNDLTEIGWYVAASTVTNRPTTDGIAYGIHTVAANGDAFYQLAFPLYVSDTKVYIRKFSVTWGDWIEVLTEENVGTAALQNTTTATYDNTIGAIMRIGDLDYARPDFTKQRLELIAHRGFLDLFPQNTMPAFTSAVRRGAASLECDVSFSAENTAYIFHDATVDALTNGSGTFTALNDAYIDSLTLTELTGTIISDTKIPTFEEFLDYASSAGVKVYVEIKAINSLANIDAMIALVEQYDMQENCVLASFSLSNLEYVRDNNKTIEIGYLGSGSSPSTYEPIIDSLSSIGRAYLMWLDDSFLADPNIVKYARQKGVGVAAYTTNSNEKARQLMKVGVNKIVSDYTLGVI